jgi:hypothetical protein
MQRNAIREVRPGGYRIGRTQLGTKQSAALPDPCDGRRSLLRRAAMDFLVAALRSCRSRRLVAGAEASVIGAVHPFCAAAQQQTYAVMNTYARPLAAADGGLPSHHASMTAGLRMREHVKLRSHDDVARTAPDYPMCPGGGNANFQA